MLHEYKYTTIINFCQAIIQHRSDILRGVILLQWLNSYPFILYIFRGFRCAFKWWFNTMRLQSLINILIMRGQLRGQLSLSLPKSPFKRSHRQAQGFWSNHSLSVLNRSQKRSYTVLIPCYDYHVVVLEKSGSFIRYHEVSVCQGMK